MTDYPWRWVQRQAPYWAARIDGLGRAGGNPGRGDPPRCLITLPVRGGSGGRLSKLQVDYYDMVRAIGELGHRHKDGAKLQLIVELRLEGYSLKEIAKALPGRASRSGVWEDLDRAWEWICHPAHGRFFDWEAWEAWGERTERTERT